MPNGVRQARATDVADIARLQWRQWQDADPASVEAALAAGLDVDAVGALWRQGLLSPASPLDRLLVATDEADAVIGFAATSASGDADAGPGQAELLELTVSRDARGAGHGSRLLAACVEILTPAGAVELSAWVVAEDGDARAFLGGAGFAPDGAERELADEQGAVTAQIRLSALLGAAGDRA